MVAYAYNPLYPVLPSLYHTHLVSVSLWISTPVRVIDREADAFNSFLLVSSVQMEIRSIYGTTILPLSSALCSRSDFDFFDFNPCVCVCFVFLPDLLCIPWLMRSLCLHPPIATLTACVFDFTPCLSCHHFVPIKRMFEFPLFFFLFFYGL